MKHGGASDERGLCICVDRVEIREGTKRERSGCVLEEKREGIYPDYECTKEGRSACVLRELSVKK